MNILLFSNVSVPQNNGVARAILAFSAACRKRDHKVLLVTPDYEGRQRDQEGVLRLPVVQNFNGSDFLAVQLDFDALNEGLNQFQPQVVHSFHPYLLGMTALRVARARQLPLVFSHHTLFEHYTHYVPQRSHILKKFVVELASRYANLSDHVTVPSETIKNLLRQRGVSQAITVLPMKPRNPQRAEIFRLENCVDKTLAIYASLAATNQQADPMVWQGMSGVIRAEWEILSTLISALNR